MIPGKKSEKEKFAGGLYTTTVEAFIPTSGRAIQGATSHCLGQNFSKMFDIVVDDPAHQRQHVWQNSWGLTTRTIGVMVMVHGDDKGLVLPPRAAQIQVVIVPCGITVKTSQETRDELMDKCTEMGVELKSAGIRVHVDLRDNVTPGFKYNHWELKGVPIRLELGPKDLKKGCTRCVRRDNFEGQDLQLQQLSQSVSDLLECIQKDMFDRARDVRDNHVKHVEEWKDFVPALNTRNLVLAPWCEVTTCEEDVKTRSSGNDEDEKAPSMGAKTLCIPFKQPDHLPKKCFACSAPTKSWTLWGRSY